MVEAVQMEDTSLQIRDMKSTEEVKFVNWDRQHKKEDHHFPRNPYSVSSSHVTTVDEPWSMMWEKIVQLLERNARNAKNITTFQPFVDQVNRIHEKAIGKDKNNNKNIGNKNLEEAILNGSGKLRKHLKNRRTARQARMMNFSVKS